MNDNVEMHDIVNKHLLNVSPIHNLIWFYLKYNTQVCNPKHLFYGCISFFVARIA